MGTIRNTIARLQADGQFTNYIKKVQKQPNVEAELQQGVFNDTGELGTSKIKRKLKRLKKRNPNAFKK